MSSPDYSFPDRRFQALQDQLRKLGGPIDPPREPPHDGGMETRLTKLETEFVHVRKDLDDIRADLRDNRTFQNEMRITLARLPSKGELFGYTATVAAIAFAIVALFVAVLAYLQDQRIAGNAVVAPPAAAVAPAPLPAAAPPATGK